jgi:hypothetical protein
MNKLLASHEAKHIRKVDLRLINPLDRKPNYIVVEQQDTGEYLINTVRDRDMAGEFLIGVDNVKSDFKDSIYGHIWKV